MCREDIYLIDVCLICLSLSLLSALFIHIILKRNLGGYQTTFIYVILYFFSISMLILGISVCLKFDEHLHN